MQRWATPTLELSIFFIGIGVKLERDIRIYGVELLPFCNSISCHKRRTIEIFDTNRCTCHLQIICIESLHLLTITVESLSMYNRHTKETRKRERERIKKNICLIYHLIFIKSPDISSTYFVELNFFLPRNFNGNEKSSIDIPTIDLTLSTCD